MLLQPVFDKVIIRMNQAINLMMEPRSLLMLADMYGALAAMFCSHNSGCTLHMGIDSLRRQGCRNLAIGKYRDMVRNVLASFPVTVDREHNYCEANWLLPNLLITVQACLAERVSKRNMPVQLSEIDRVLFSLSTRILFVQIHQVLTLYDDLVRSRDTDVLHRMYYM